jgi:hypothetical protein
MNLEEREEADVGWIHQAPDRGNSILIDSKTVKKLLIYHH